MRDDLQNGLLLDLPAAAPTVIEGPGQCAVPRSALSFECTAERLEVGESFSVSAFAYAEGPGLPGRDSNRRFNRAVAGGADIDGDFDQVEVRVAPASSDSTPVIRCRTASVVSAERLPSDSVQELLPNIEFLCQGPIDYAGPEDWALSITNATISQGSAPPQLVVDDPSGGGSQTFEGSISISNDRVVWPATVDFSNGGMAGGRIINLVVDPSTGTEGELATDELRIAVPRGPGSLQARNDPVVSALSDQPITRDWSCVREPDSSPGDLGFTCLELDGGGPAGLQDLVVDNGVSVRIRVPGGPGPFPSLPLVNNRLVIDSVDLFEGVIGGSGIWQRIEGSNADFTGGGPVTDPDNTVNFTLEQDTPAEFLFRPNRPEGDGRPRALRFRLQFDCQDNPPGRLIVEAGRTPTSLRLVEVANPPIARFEPTKAHIFDIADPCRPMQAPAAPVGNVGAASGSPVGPGLGSLFFASSLAGVESRVATGLPLPRRLGDTELLFLVAPETISLSGKGSAPLQSQPEGPIGVFAPLLFTSPTQINYQVPWEAVGAAERVQAMLTVNGVRSELFDVELADFSPGVFSFDFGPGRAVAINSDGSVAHPADSFAGAVPSRPVRIGEALIILATGLGPVTPEAITGFNSLDANGDFVRRDTVQTPQVTIGGVEQQVLFSGLSPQFVGVYQLNVLVAQGTPTGNAQPLIIEIGGARSRDDVTLAVGP